MDHNRDMNLAYAAVEQMMGKYLVQDRVTKRVYESPQFLYVLVGMCLFAGYDKAQRLDYISVFMMPPQIFTSPYPHRLCQGAYTDTPI